MGFLDRLKAKAKAKIKASGAKSVAKIRAKQPRTKGVESAGKLVDEAFRKGNTVGKTSKVLKSKKK